MLVVFILIADSLGEGKRETEADFSNQADHKDRGDQGRMSDGNVRNAGNHHEYRDDRHESQACAFGKSHKKSLTLQNRTGWRFLRMYVTMSRL